MTNKDNSNVGINRRRFLGGVGMLSGVSLSGCLEFKDIGPDNDNNGKKISNRVQLSRFPDTFEYSTDRLAVPSADLIESLNLRPEQQIRVKRPGQNFSGDFLSALYSTRLNVDFDKEKQNNTIWMSDAALERINSDEGWYVSVNTYAPNENMETDEEAKANSEYVEKAITANNSNLIVLAPHGGNIYRGTDTAAIRVASELQVNGWICHGYNSGGGAFDRWFIDQNKIHPRSFPKLGEFVDYQGSDTEDFNHQYRVTYQRAVLLTGTDKRGVYVGGLIPEEVKTKVRDAIAEELVGAGGNSIPVSFVRTGSLAATDTMNLANRLSYSGNKGIQIALGKEVRENYWKEISDAVISVFQNLEY